MAYGGGVASVVSTVGVLCRKQAVSIRPVPRASLNNSIRSLSLRDLALLRRSHIITSFALYYVVRFFRGPDFVCVGKRQHHHHHRLDYDGF